MGEKPQDASVSSVNGDRLFVTNIPNCCPAKQLKEYFLLFGNILEFCMSMIGGSSWRRGIAFVQYDCVESVSTVKETGPHFIWGQELIIDSAVSNNPIGISTAKPCACGNFPDEYVVNQSGNSNWGCLRTDRASLSSLDDASKSVVPSFFGTAAAMSVSDRYNCPGNIPQHCPSTKHRGGAINQVCHEQP